MLAFGLTTPYNHTHNVAASEWSSRLQASCVWLFFLATSCHDIVLQHYSLHTDLVRAKTIYIYISNILPKAKGKPSKAMTLGSG